MSSKQLKPSEEILLHYGTKGMKWDKDKRPKTTTWGEMSGEDDMKRYKEIKRMSQTERDKLEIDIRKQLNLQKQNTKMVSANQTRKGYETAQLMVRNATKKDELNTPGYKKAVNKIKKALKKVVTKKPKKKAVITTTSSSWGNKKP